jgi:prefoldin alpha subunit
MPQELNQELLQKAQLLHGQSQELEQQIEFIGKQIEELALFISTIETLMKTSQTEALSSLGKGVFIKTNIIEKELFVEVGSGIVLRKSLPETKKVIQEQISRFKEMQSQLKAQLEIYQSTLSSAVQELQNSQK